MGVGVALAVLGAILAFAVRADPKGINLPVVGVILMVAGAALIWNARRTTTRERIVTRIEEPADPSKPVHRVRRTVRETEGEL